MEDKNLEPLVPDMLYRHTPETADAALFSQDPVFTAPTVDAESDPKEAPVENQLNAEDSEPTPAFIEEDSLYPDLPVTEDGALSADFAEEAPLSTFIPTDDLLFGVPEEDSSLNIPQGETEPEKPNPPVAEPEQPQEPEFTDMRVEKTREKKSSHEKKKQDPPVRKGRPKRKKGIGFLGIPHLIATLIWLGIIVMIGSSLGKLLWVGAADVLAFGREDKVVAVTIVDSDTIDTIAVKLQEVGLVKYPALFKVYANLTGAEEEITTGTFTLNTNLDYHALTNALSPSSSNRAVVKVTIPEGYSCRQIFQLLAASNVCSVSALEEYAANGELPAYWFLENVARGDRYCLEGYLFPDTYEFYANSTPKEALSKMLSGFSVRFTDEMKAQVETLNQHLSELMRNDGRSDDYIASHQITIREIMIIASMVEKETAGSGESPTIASVIYNRLYNWGSTPAYLNIDASIYYALDGNIDPETGNTMPLTSENMKVDSPYNTYKYAGLTPTPITNPGLTSIQAALNPQSTSYYYYVLNPETNVHQFSKTLEEHEKWVSKFYSSED